MAQDLDHHLEAYEDEGGQILSADAKVPLWLKLTYFILPIWGVLCFAYYWNGSHGWLDRGYWGALQQAANTAYPYRDAADPDLEKQLQEEQAFFKAQEESVNQ